MSNFIGASLIESMRRSGDTTTLVSKTCAFPPLFVKIEDLPGVAKAWVVFNGITSPGGTCQIFNKSTNVSSVSCSGIGLYTIVLAPSTFFDGNYIVNGSILFNSNISPVSAANTFFVAGSASHGGAFNPRPGAFRIQTLYVPVISGSGFTSGPAFANRVSLLMFK
jgi:hypothetical protein